MFDTISSIMMRTFICHSLHYDASHNILDENKPLKWIHSIASGVISSFNTASLENLLKLSIVNYVCDKINLGLLNEFHQPYLFVWAEWDTFTEMEMPKAEQALREQLKSSRHSLGETHPDTLTACLQLRQDACQGPTNSQYSCMVLFACFSIFNTDIK